jgi:hypothetical protein
MGGGVEKGLHSGNFFFALWWENYLKVSPQSTSVTNNIGSEGGGWRKPYRVATFYFAFSIFQVQLTLFCLGFLHTL